MGPLALDVGGEHALDQIEAARPEVREPHGAIDDRQVGDLVDEDFILVPIVGEFLDHDAILLDALDELVGAGAHRMQTELVARRFGRLGRNHHAGAVGELGEQWRERFLQDEPDRHRIDDLDLVDRSQVGLAERALHREVAVEAVLGGLGVERLAVVERHARPELDGDGLAVGRGLLAERQLRHDVELVVDIEQLVAERGEDDAADIGARESRIEHVRILGKADAQVGLCSSRADRGDRKQQRQRQAAEIHDHQAPHSFERQQ